MPFLVRATLFSLFFLLYSNTLISQDKAPEIDLVLKHNKKWKNSRIKHGGTIQLVLLNQKGAAKRVKGTFTYAQDSIIYVDTVGYHVSEIKKIKAKSEFSRQNGIEEIIYGSAQIATIGALYLVLNNNVGGFLRVSSAILIVPMAVGGTFYLVRGIRELIFYKPYRLDNERWRVEFDNPDKRKQGRKKNIRKPLLE
jgi:hypothetical protein